MHERVELKPHVVSDLNRPEERKWINCNNLSCKGYVKKVHFMNVKKALKLYFTAEIPIYFTIRNLVCAFSWYLFFAKNHFLTVSH